jgi:hypothetical protein
MNAAIEAMSSKEVGSYKASRIFTICLPPHSSHKIQPLGKVFVGPPKTFYCQEIKKMTSFKPKAIRDRLPNLQTVRKIQAIK